MPHILLDKVVLDRLLPGHDLLVAGSPIRVGWRQLQPVERTLARERLAPVFAPESIPPQRIGLATQTGQERIGAKPVMVVEVFIAQGQAIHPLAEQFQQFMFDQILIPVVLEALGKPLGVAVAPIQPGQEHAAPVPGNVSGLKIDHHGTTA